MSKVVLPTRSSVNIFTDDADLKFFYENFLLYCESDRKYYGNFECLKSAAKAIEGSFDFVYKDYETKMETPVENVFYFSAETEKQDSKRQNSAVAKKWFKHIRNSFAHNYITIEDGQYVLQDFFQEEKQPLRQVLYAKLTSLEEFKGLVAEIMHNIEECKIKKDSNNETPKH